MLTFKIQGTKVMFFCGRNVIGMFESLTILTVNPARLAAKLRDFGTMEERIVVLKIALDAVLDAA